MAPGPDYHQNFVQHIMKYFKTVNIILVIILILTSYRLRVPFLLAKQRVYSSLKYIQKIDIQMKRRHQSNYCFINRYYMRLSNNTQQRY